MEKLGYSKINNFCLIFLTGFAMTGTLIFMKPALVPLVCSFFLYGIVSSLVRWTSIHLRINKFIAFVVVAMVLVFVTYGAGWIILHSMGEFLPNLDQYKNQVITLLQTGIDWLPLHSFGWKVDTILQDLRDMPLAYARIITSTMVILAGNIFLILAFLLFFLLGERKNRSDKSTFKKHS